MYFTLFIFVCIKLSSIEAGTLPRAYHPLRGGNRHTIRLFPIQMRDDEQPSDNYSWRRINLQNVRDDEDEEYVPVTPNIGLYNSMVLNLGNPTNDKNLEDADEEYYVHGPYKNNMVLDIVRQMAHNLKTRDERTSSVDFADPYNNLRSPESMENSQEIRSLFGSKGYVHLTYPSKQRNNMLNDILRQLAKNLRTSDVTKSIKESAPSDYNLKHKALFLDLETVLLNPHNKKRKDIGEAVKELLKSLRLQPTGSVETKDKRNVRTFDTIVHFEEGPRRILDNDDLDGGGIAFEDLFDPNKEDLVVDAANRLAKAESQKAWDKDYQDSFNGDEGRRADSAATPKTVYEFNELVI